jgi:hypothetical protein
VKLHETGLPRSGGLVSFHDLKLRVGEWVRDRAVKFFDWNTETLVSFTMKRVAVMRLLGNWRGALKLMESAAGLTTEDYSDPAQALAKLRARHEGLAPELALAFMLQLTTFMVDAGLIAEAAALHEQDAAVQRSDYADPHQLSDRLRMRTEQLSPEFAFLYSLRLANVVGLANRPSDELAILEGMLGLRLDDYSDSSRLASLLAKALNEKMPFVRIWYLQLLAATLGKVGRIDESNRVIATLKGFKIDTENVETGFQGVLRRSLDAMAEAGSRSLINIALDRSGDGDLALASLESGLGLTATDYEDLPLLRSRLKAYMANIPPEVVGVSLQNIFGPFIEAGRAKVALRLLAADAGFEDIDLQHPDIIVSKIQRRCRDLPSNQSSIYIAVSAFVFESAELPEIGVQVLTTDADLAVDWRKMSEVTARLEARLGYLEVSSAVTYVGLLVSALQAADQGERAALLVDAYLRGMSPLAADKEELALSVPLCLLYDTWLSWWGEDASREPLAACVELVPYLRGSLAEQGTTLHDREDFVRTVGELRRRIVQTAYFWAEAEPVAEKRGEMLHTAQLWDIELGQRLLIERFLLTEIRRSPAGQRPASNRWPFQEARGLTSAYRPFKGELLPFSDVALGEEPGVPLLPSSSVREARSDFRHERPELYTKTQQRLRLGVDEEAMAETLGSQGFLLRATFDSSGRLLWSALAGRGRGCEVVAHGAGSAGDLGSLRWATALHDFRISYIRWLVTSLPMARPAGRDCLAALVGGLVSCLEGATYQKERLDGILETFAERSGEMGKAGERLAHFRALLLAPLGAVSSTDGRATALTAFRAADLFLKGADALARRPLRSVLDRITAGYLRQIASRWSLDPLASVLTPTSEVIVQVEDALHSVPMSWLPVRGRPLYRRVAFVRSTLAPLMDELQGEIEGESGADAPRRMLSISWLKPEDGARPGARWFHQGQLRLAEQYGYECLAGADADGGSIGSLRAALEERGFATAAIYGHGDFEHAGIALGAGDEDGDRSVLWQGDGCDLSHAEWLLLVSCSIGRVRQGGDLDIEGFCVQLAVHRARSVLACRWQVSAVEAAAFASEAVNQYLELRSRAEKPAGLRALALARARRRLTGRGYAPVGLNTAAAFELYGLG